MVPSHFTRMRTTRTANHRRQEVVAWAHVNGGRVIAIFVRYFVVGLATRAADGIVKGDGEVFAEALEVQWPHCGHGRFVPGR